VLVVLEHFDHSDENVHKRQKEAYRKKQETHSIIQQMTKFSWTTYSAPSRTLTNGAKYKTEAWKRYQVIKTRKKEAAAGACNLQCPRWKDGQIGAPPIL
jgi:hypothetical protein